MLRLLRFVGSHIVPNDLVVHGLDSRCLARTASSLTTRWTTRLEKPDRHFHSKRLQLALLLAEGFKKLLVVSGSILQSFCCSEGKRQDWPRAWAARQHFP